MYITQTKNGGSDILSENRVYIIKNERKIRDRVTRNADRLRIEHRNPARKKRLFDKRYINFDCLSRFSSSVSVVSRARERRGIIWR